jgi:hypothetical protein
MAANLNDMVHRLVAQVRNNAVAYTALFVALGGTAFAASAALPRNSVGTPQLKSRAVTGRKIALHAVTGANVAKATLTGANIKSSTLGTVPDAARLGGLSPLSFQRAITGRCVGSQAIQTVAQQGKVTCHSFGTITGVVAATGLTGGGSSGHVSLAVDPTVVQARVTDSCAAGRAISSIKQDGSIGCHIADVTQMMGGTGTAALDPTAAFIAPVGLSAPNSQVQAVAVGSADLPSTARHLSVKVATAPPSGGSWKFNFYVNGRIRTGLGCVITSPEHSCHSGGSVSIPRGARIALHETGTNLTTGTSAIFGWTDTTF